MVVVGSSSSKSNSNNDSPPPQSAIATATPGQMSSQSEQDKQQETTSPKPPAPQQQSSTSSYIVSSYFIAGCVRTVLPWLDPAYEFLADALLRLPRAVAGMFVISPGDRHLRVLPNIDPVLLTPFPLSCQGAASRTSVAPLERLKIIYQCQGNSRAYGGVFSALGKIWREEGMKGMFRGNGVCVPQELDGNLFG